jgi:hypothetical protein
MLFGLILNLNHQPTVGFEYVDHVHAMVVFIFLFVVYDLLFICYRCYSSLMSISLTAFEIHYAIMVDLDWQQMYFLVQDNPSSFTILFCYLVHYMVLNQYFKQLVIHHLMLFDFK